MSHYISIRHSAFSIKKIHEIVCLCGAPGLRAKFFIREFLIFWKVVSVQLEKCFKPLKYSGRPVQLKDEFKWTEQSVYAFSITKIYYISCTDLCYHICLDEVEKIHILLHSIIQLQIEATPIHNIHIIARNVSNAKYLSIDFSYVIQYIVSSLILEISVFAVITSSSSIICCIKDFKRNV